MEISEKELEDIIFKTTRTKLQEKGLVINGKMYRQLKIGNYGVADLVTLERKIDLLFYPTKILPFPLVTVYELKKCQINFETFLQSIRYLRGIKSYLNKNDKLQNAIFKIVLIGNSIDTNSDFIYLPDLLPEIENNESFLQIYLYKIDIDGVYFEEVYNYTLIHEGF